MDFWSRLIGGGSLPPAKQASNKTPQQRLSRLKRANEQILQLWRESKKVPLSPAAAEDARSCLELIWRILLDESRGSAPYLCCEHVASAQIYNAAAELASTCPDGAVAHEVVCLLNVLVDRDEGDLLQSPAFADAIAGLAVQLSTSGALDSETEAILFEILFGIAAKLKLEPEYIDCWFKPSKERAKAADSGTAAKTSSLSLDDEFPLFHILLHNVLQEGRIGEFARTGLLYIIESTERSETLEHWIVESDLAAIMAGGLGALYSQLSRRLNFMYSEGTIPTIVTFSEVSQALYVDAQETVLVDFQTNFDAFLTYLTFWQDMLEHCTSPDIKQTLLDHFEFLFLQQVLYPSLLESSDTDSSSVAALTYLKCILDHINHQNLIHSTLQYLFAAARKVEDRPSSKRPVALTRRRKSESLVSRRLNGELGHSPDLFSLADLIQGSLRSRNQQTTTATLRLLAILVGSQHRYAIAHLITTTNSPCASRRRNLKDHEWNVNFLLDMADALALDDDLGVAYDSYLQDASTLLELHPCSAELLDLPIAETPPNRHRHGQDTQCSQTLKVQPHWVRQDDPLLQSLLSLFEKFLVNDIETNLSLTKVMSCLASCPLTGLEGWLVSSQCRQNTDLQDQPSSPQSSQHKTLSQDPDSDASNENQESIETFEDHNGHRFTLSPVFQSLDTLVKQVQRFDQEIEHFDTYLAERRHVFKIGEEIESALKDTPALPRRSDNSNATSPTRKRNAPQITTISERLLSENNSTTVSRSISPRGRQRGDQITPTLLGRLSHLRISPSPSPSKTASSAHSRSPFRKGSLSSTPPRGLRSPISPGNALHRKIKIPVNASAMQHHAESVRSGDEISARSESLGSEARGQDTVEVCLSHLLTNVIILQEFLLELAAIVEVRASLFSEVSLD